MGYQIGGFGVLFRYQYFSYIVEVSFISGGNRSIPGTPSTCRKSLPNFITQCCIEYIRWCAGFELTTLVVTGTDCSGSCKSNYHTIMTTVSFIGGEKYNILWKQQPFCTPLSELSYALMLYWMHLARGRRGLYSQILHTCAQDPNTQRYNNQHSSFHFHTKQYNNFIFLFKNYEHIMNMHASHSEFQKYYRPNENKNMCESRVCTKYCNW